MGWQIEKGYTSLLRSGFTNHGAAVEAGLSLNASKGYVVKKVISIAAVLLAACLFIIWNAHMIMNSSGSTIEKEIMVQNKEEKMSFSSREYANDKIRIAYPQLLGEKCALVNKINDTISKGALRILEHDRNDETLTNIGIDYRIEIVGVELASIRFFGLIINEDTAYPQNVFYTTNISLETGKEMSPADIFHLGRSFISHFADEGQYVRDDASPDADLATEVRLWFANNTDQLLQELKNDDESIESAQIYFSDNAVGISFSVPHALGDYAILELPIKELKPFITNDTSVMDVLP